MVTPTSKTIFSEKEWNPSTQACNDFSLLEGTSEILLECFLFSSGGKNTENRSFVTFQRRGHLVCSVTFLSFISKVPTVVCKQEKIISYKDQQWKIILEHFAWQTSGWKNKFCRHMQNSCSQHQDSIASAVGRHLLEKVSAKEEHFFSAIFGIFCDKTGFLRNTWWDSVLFYASQRDPLGLIREPQHDKTDQHIDLHAAWLKMPTDPKWKWSGVGTQLCSQPVFFVEKRVEKRSQEDHEWTPLWKKPRCSEGKSGPVHTLRILLKPRRMMMLIWHGQTKGAARWPGVLSKTWGQRRALQHEAKFRWEQNYQKPSHESWIYIYIIRLSSQMAPTIYLITDKLIHGCIYKESKKNLMLKKKGATVWMFCPSPSQKSCWKGFPSDESYIYGVWVVILSDHGMKRWHHDITVLKCRSNHDCVGVGVVGFVCMHPIQPDNMTTVSPKVGKWGWQFFLGGGQQCQTRISCLWLFVASPPQKTLLYLYFPGIA